MPVLDFLCAKWRWLAWGLAVILAVRVLSQATDYLTSLLRGHHAAKVITTTAARREARQTADQAARQHSDSIRFQLAGRRAEQQRALTLLQHLDDSLTKRLPVAPELPARPPRYRPGGGQAATR